MELCPCNKPTGKRILSLGRRPMLGRGNMHTYRKMAMCHLPRQIPYSNKRGAIFGFCVLFPSCYEPFSMATATFPVKHHLWLQVSNHCNTLFKSPSFQSQQQSATTLKRSIAPWVIWYEMVWSCRKIMCELPFQALREFSLESYLERNIGACWKERRSLLERNAGACWKGMPELGDKERRSLLERNAGAFKLVALTSSGSFEKKWQVPVISWLMQ